jgi:hypothetical protein
MPDNLALCLSVWGIFMFFLWLKQSKWYALPVSGLLLAIGSLCKLPFVLYFSIPLTWFLLEALRDKKWKSPMLRAACISVFMLPVLAWYVSVVPQWQGNGIVAGMLENKVSGSVLLGNFLHHLFITLPDLLLNYGSVLFFLGGFYFIVKNRSYRSPLFLVLAVLGVILIFYFLFELNMIGKSHDYYFFPYFPLLFILVAYGAYHLIRMKSRLIRVSVIVILLILPVTAFLRIDKRWDLEKPGFNKDLLVYKDELRDAVPKDALCIAGNDISHFIFFYYIDKKGWGFDGDRLNDGKVRKMIEEGAAYLYSDSRKVDEDPRIIPFLEEKIMEKGTVRVFRLKPQGFQP